MSNIVRLSVAATLALMLASPVAAQTAPRSVSTADMDTTCPACKDSFTFANGAWVRRTTIPAEYGSYDGFTEIYDRNLEALHRILNDAAAHGAGSGNANEQKIGAYYASCMDSAAADRAGITPVRALLDTIDAIRTPADVMRTLAMLHRRGIGAGFTLSYESDPKSSDQTIGQLYQGGLGLPDRDYYTKSDPQSDSLRQVYVAHIGKLLTLAGERGRGQNLVTAAG